MALRFKTSNDTKLFFPTVHIHDCQGKYKELVHDWTESHVLANTHMDLEKSEGFIAGDAHIYRRQISGLHPNKDVILTWG